MKINPEVQNTNKNINMNEQLEKLIDIELIDGVLTEKEKQILLKKVEVAGFYNEIKSKEINLKH